MVPFPTFLITTSYVILSFYDQQQMTLLPPQRGVWYDHGHKLLPHHEYVQHSDRYLQYPSVGSLVPSNLAMGTVAQQPEKTASQPPPSSKWGAPPMSLLERAPRDPPPGPLGPTKERRASHPTCRVWGCWVAEACHSAGTSPSRGWGWSCETRPAGSAPWSSWRLSACWCPAAKLGVREENGM